MTTPAAPEAPKNAAPPAAAAPAVDPDDAELPPLDHDAEIGQQVKRAKEVVARNERKAAKAAKAAEKPAAAKPEKPAADKGKASEEPKPDEGPAAPTAATLAQARKLLEDGDAEAAFKLAFGKSPDALRINSARWVEWRKANQAAERALAEKQQAVVGAARELEQRFGNMLAAKKAYDSEDYEGALKLAFGDELNTFQKKAIARFHGKNPEVEKLKAELRERDEREAQERQQAKQQLHAQEVQRAHSENLQIVAGTIAQSQDPEIAALAKRPRFAQRVYELALQNFDLRRDPLAGITAAAEMVRDEIVEEFGPVFGRSRSVSESPHQGGINPESPHRAGTKPARPGAADAAPTTLSQRGAQEASPPGRALSDAELFRKYEQLAKASNG